MPSWIRSMNPMAHILFLEGPLVLVHGSCQVWGCTDNDPQVPQNHENHLKNLSSQQRPLQLPVPSFRPSKAQLRKLCSQPRSQTGGEKSYIVGACDGQVIFGTKDSGSRQALESQLEFGMVFVHGNRDAGRSKVLL